MRIEASIMNDIERKQVVGTDMWKKWNGNRISKQIMK